MNVGAQLGAVTPAYIGRIIIVKGVQVLLAPLMHVRTSHRLGYAPAENFGILDFLRWSLMHLLNKKEPANAQPKLCTLVLLL